MSRGNKIMVGMIRLSFAISAVIFVIFSAVGMWLMAVTALDIYKGPGSAASHHSAAVDMELTIVLYVFCASFIVMVLTVWICSVIGWVLCGFYGEQPRQWREILVTELRNS